jgi:DNA-binding response OmpR family regulator
MIRVLVVDDNDPFLQAIGFFLDASGLSTQLAGNGEAAMKCVSGGLPDVAVLDVELPDISGIALCSKLRKAAPECDLPVIMITGRPHQEVIPAAKAAGAREVMVKPFELGDLDVAIRKHVSSSGPTPAKPKSP